MPTRRDSILGVIALVTLCHVPSLGATQSTLAGGIPSLATLPVDTVVERITSAADPREQYAAFLPPHYRTDRTWPVLVLLDPRGRALLPLERIRPVARRLGYIVISSYNSRSDEPVDHNASAVDAILNDADRMLAIDPHRIYLVGQSGTARSGWLFGYALRENVAGIIGFGAGLPPGFTPPLPTPGGAHGPAFYGAAGTDDYNFDELWNLDARLDSLGLTHHIEWFDGIHAWPGTAEMTEAVEWMQLQAMRRGLIAPNLPWIDSLYRSRLANAANVRDGGGAYRAWREFRSMESDFAGAHDITAAHTARRALEQRGSVLDTERHMADLVRQQNGFNERLGLLLGELRDTPPPFESAWRRLGIDRLIEQARDPVDTMAAHAARRALEQVWVYISFYEPREYLVRNDPARALALLALAERLRPGDAGVSLYRAEALAREGKAPDFLMALKDAARAGALPEALNRDANLTALRADPRSSVQLERLDSPTVMLQ